MSFGRTLSKKSIFPWSWKIFVSVIINFCVNRIKVEIKLNQIYFKYGEILNRKQWGQWEGHKLHVWFVDNGFIWKCTNNIKTIKKHKENPKRLFAENVKEVYQHLLGVIDLIFLDHSNYSSYSTGFPHIILQNLTF